MLCSTCKNPVEDNATTCEWCGNIIVHNIDNENISNDFDYEMQYLLKGEMSYNGKKGVAALVPFTQNKYKCRTIEAKYRVEKWKYFSKNKDANLSDWKAYTKRTQNKNGFFGFLCCATIIGIIPGIFFFAKGIMWTRFELMTE